MDLGHLRELMAVEEGYWWHRAKRALVTELLRRAFPPPGRLIEGGIGAGGNLAVFARQGYQVTGFDVAAEAVRHCRGLGLSDVHVHDLEAPWPVPPGSGRAVVLLDVLEHLADPVRVLGHAARSLAPGGGAVITVPAGPSLMGPWDEMLGHYRRYTPALLRAQAEEAGLRTRWVSHWNAFTYPAAWVVRRLQKRRGVASGAEFPRVPGWMNALLGWMAGAERGWMRCCRVPVGLSLVGVFER